MIRIFPNRASVVRLIGALLMEIDAGFEQTLLGLFALFFRQKSGIGPTLAFYSRIHTVILLSLYKSKAILNNYVESPKMTRSTRSISPPDRKGPCRTLREAGMRLVLNHYPSRAVGVRPSCSDHTPLRSHKPHLYRS